MPKLHSSKQILSFLHKNGFFIVGQRGSHIKLRKDGQKILTVILPANRKEIPAGTFASILRQAGISKDDFKI